MSSQLFPPASSQGTGVALVLASASPGRASILRSAGIGFEQIVSHVDEAKAMADAGPLSPAETAQFLARLKAEAVADLPQAKGSLILGCDSVFEFEGQAFGKPYTREAARERLRAQSGGTGLLHSGHWLIDRRENTLSDSSRPSSGRGRIVSTEVTFAELSSREIESYVQTDEPLHCAGSFTIDARGAALIQRISGDPAAVVGLSVFALRELAGEVGLSIDALWVPVAQ